jgi:DNA topoisomerase IB
MSTRRRSLPVTSRRRERLYPRGDRRRLHRQELPHLGRQRHRLRADAEAQEEEVRKISLKTVLEPVAEALGNTPAISRKSYVHPKLIEAARDNPKLPLGAFERPRARKYLSSEEVGLLDWLMKGKRKRPVKRKEAESGSRPRSQAPEVSMDKVDEVAEGCAVAEDGLRGRALQAGPSSASRA